LAFDIKGNDYRLVVAIDSGKAIVWIKWIGVHAKYDGIDVLATLIDVFEFEPYPVNAPDPIS
jgi:mRNA interferase HigB